MCFAQCSFPTALNGRLLLYSFEPSVSKEATVLHITLTFQGGLEGIATLELPSTWAGEIHLYNAVTHLHAVSADTIIDDTAEPQTKIVRFQPGKTVTFAYDLVKDWHGALRHPMEFRAVLEPGYFEFRAGNGLVHPKLDDPAAVTVNLEWKLPESWALATSFGANQRCQSFSGTWKPVEDALFTAGDFRIHHFEIEGQPAVLAVRGQWRFTDDEAILDLQKVIAMVRDFWHDNNFPYYLITLKPFDTERDNSDGTALTNAFWLYLSRQDNFSDQLVTLAHETFHAWNPGLMGDLLRPIPWFTEGFTRYYGNLLVYRAGLSTLPAYLDGTNRSLRQYPQSSDPDARGRILAQWLDGRIRQASNNKRSLDNLMFDLLKRRNRPLTQARILKTAGRFLPPTARLQLRQAVDKNADLSAFNALALGPCVRVAIDEVRPFDLGFDFAASQAAHRVIGVKLGGEAHNAGLEDGQRLSGWSVHNDQPDKPARFSVETQGGVKKIEYLPRGKPIKVPQYHLEQNCRVTGRAGE